ncbi:MAG: hypothetical protein PHZ19_03920 [Candidatus Thermoplasmatota archaeon]|nr:hypothetical protein [Candidatus Thermoplasmatota archaeon]
MSKPYQVYRHGDVAISIVPRGGGYSWEAHRMGMGPDFVTRRVGAVGEVRTESLAREAAEAEAARVTAAWEALQPPDLASDPARETTPAFPKEAPADAGVCWMVIAVVGWFAAIVMGTIAAILGWR